MTRLLAFDGFAGCGKDAIADGLVRHHGFTKVPFALPMKRTFAKVFNLPQYYFDVRALKDSPLTSPIILDAGHIATLIEELNSLGLQVGEHEILACKHHLGKSLNSPREIMQYIGTDVVRKDVDNLAWIKLWDIEQQKYAKVIAPDARFSNERDYVKKVHGKVLLVKREGIETMNHVSENDKWPDDKYDAMILNDVSLARIISEVCLWYTLIK